MIQTKSWHNLQITFYSAFMSAQKHAVMPVVLQSFLVTTPTLGAILTGEASTYPPNLETPSLNPIGTISK